MVLIKYNYYFSICIDYDIRVVKDGYVFVEKHNGWGN